MSDERILTIPDDDSNPYGPSHDSIIKTYIVREDIDNDTGRGWHMHLLWGPLKANEIKLIAIAPTCYYSVNGTRTIYPISIGYINEYSAAFGINI